MNLAVNGSANIITALGQVPVVGAVLRWYARRYEEGSIVRIARGYASGMKWKRYHRYVNGYWTGIYEIDLQKALARELKKGDVFYDLGANAGFFSLLAAKLVGPEGRVFAFEPLPENIESVNEQIFINSLDYCELIPKAVSDRSGVIRFAAASHSSMGRIDGGDDKAVKQTLMVETVSLDEFVRDHPRPDFIKIDVEGAEADVLIGAETLLRSKDAPSLLIELHGRDKARKIEAILDSCGYLLADVFGNAFKDGASEQHHIIAYPPARWSRSANE
jgi:FkbM family methyltransferase